MDRRRSGNDPVKSDYFNRVFEVFRRLGIPLNRIEARVYSGSIARLTRPGAEETWKDLFLREGIDLQFVGFDPNRREEGTIKFVGQGLGDFKILDLETGQVDQMFEPSIGGWINFWPGELGRIDDELQPMPSSLGEQDGSRHNLEIPNTVLSR